MRTTKEFKELLFEVYNLDNGKDFKETLAKLKADLDKLPAKQGSPVFLVVEGHGDNGSPPSVHCRGFRYSEEANYPALEELILLVAEQYVPGYDCENGGWAELALEPDEKGVWGIELRTHYN